MQTTASRYNEFAICRDIYCTKQTYGFSRHRAFRYLYVLKLNQNQPLLPGIRKQTAFAIKEIDSRCPLVMSGYTERRRWLHCCVWPPPARRCPTPAIIGPTSDIRPSSSRRRPFMFHVRPERPDRPPIPSYRFDCGARARGRERGGEVRLQRSAGAVQRERERCGCSGAPVRCRERGRGAAAAARRCSWCSCSPSQSTLNLGRTDFSSKF